MEDIVKMQNDLMNKMTSDVDSVKESVKILTNKLDSLTAAHAMGRAEQKLPSQSISTGAPKMVTSRAPDGPFWGRRQALPKFWGRAPTPAAPKRRPQKNLKFYICEIFTKLARFH
jgi:hypothetical protein